MMRSAPYFNIHVFFLFLSTIFDNCVVLSNADWEVLRCAYSVVAATVLHFSLTIEAAFFSFLFFFFSKISTSTKKELDCFI